MTADKKSILLLGESNVGKTHFGAQLLKRLVTGNSRLTMQGLATNLEAFEQTMEQLSEGLASGHTAATSYVESIWPVGTPNGERADLIWPDYGGEQIRALVAEHRIPSEWRSRVLAGTDWILLIRLHIMRNDEDLFSKPLAKLGGPKVEVEEFTPSDQARLVELLQMLLHIGGHSTDAPIATPSLTILLSCWDEVSAEGAPLEVFRTRLPMFSNYVESVWDSPQVIGLSALERSLSEKTADKDFAIKGPETFGYVVLPDGTRENDISWPIQRLLTR